MKRLYRINEALSVRLKKSFDEFVPQIHKSWQLEKVCQGTPVSGGTSCPVGKYRMVHVPDPYPVWWQSCCSSKTLNMGDFVGLIGDVAARKEIFEELSSKFYGLRGIPIEVIKPKSKTELFRGKYIKFEPLLKVPISTDTLTVKYGKTCSLCKRSSATLYGMEQPAQDVLSVWPNFTFRDYVPRKDREGFCVRESMISGYDFFQGHTFLLCTEEVKNYVELRSWSNVSFVEYGEVI
jgi:hypothetical protein